MDIFELASEVSKKTVRSKIAKFAEELFSGQS